MFIIRYNIEKVKGETKKANDILNDVLFADLSVYDNNESFYHGYIFKTLRLFASISNSESGNGRLDIWLEDKKTRQGIVLELKHSKHEEDLEKDAEKAVKQIIDKCYLKDGEIGYGISFNRKRCCIKKV